MTALSADACAPSATHAIGDDAATALSATLKALADPLRLRMLSAIATDPRGEACVCDLAALSDVSQPTISHHLKKMRETGLLLAERRGTWVYYRIAPARRDAVTALLDSFAPAATTEVPPEAGNRTSTRAAMDAQVSRLADELSIEWNRLSRGLVATIVRESHAGLMRSDTLTDRLLSRTERFARQRLADLARDRSTAVPQVLFVCVANAGRSQLAAALANQIAGGRIIARSAGSTPAAEVHPHVGRVLGDIAGAHAAAQAFPKPLTDDAVRAADVVVTMGCGDVCPIIPGVRYEDWAVGDPALASPEGVDAIRDEIESRVGTLVEELLSDRHEKQKDPQ